MKFKQVCTTVKNSVVKNSPLALTVTGVVGLGATGILSYKSAKGVDTFLQAIEDGKTMKLEQEELKVKMNDEDYDVTEEESDNERMDILNKIDFSMLEKRNVIMGVAREVALPIVVGTLSVSAIVLSFYIQNNRIKGLAAALGTAIAERAYYGNKYKEQYGEEEYEKFTTPTKDTETIYTDEKGKDTKVKGKEQDVQPSLYGRWFDQSTEYASDDHDLNQATIAAAKSAIENRLFAKGTVTLNELNETFGFPKTKMGSYMGWTVEKGLDVSSTVTNVTNKNTGEIRPEIFVKWTPLKTVFDSIDTDDDYIDGFGAI